MKKIKSILLTILICFFPNLGFAQQLIRCLENSGREIYISIDSNVYKNTMLNCISGDWIYDMTPCAPKGGWGLSSPMGKAVIVNVVYRWQDFSNHDGGIVGNIINDSEIIFEGGSHYSSMWRSKWQFKVSRVTGVGILNIIKVADHDLGQGIKEGETNFTCDKVTRKF